MLALKLGCYLFYKNKSNTRISAMLLRHGEKEKENPTLEASRKQHKKSFQDDQFNKNVLFYRSRSSIIHTYKHIMHIRGCNPLYMLQTISSNCHKNHFLS